MPFIQIVDEQDKPIGGATKQEAWDKGLVHRIVRAMAQDENGRLLLQKRAPHKVPYPNCWDWVPAGHVDEGETYDQAMQREAEEELGIKIDNQALKPLKVYRSAKVNQGRKLNRFNKVYQLKVSSSAPISIDPEEATEYHWFKIDELAQALAKNPDAFTTSVQELFPTYFDNENHRD